MILEYFEELESALKKKIDANPELPNARRKFALNIAKLGKRLFTEGERVAWCGIVAPFELLNAMGINSCFVEFVGAMLASMGAAPSMLERAEKSGYFTDSCAYHRLVIGAAVSGLIPKPDFLIATTTPCTGGLAVIENLARLYKKDLFVINLPYDREEKDVSYLAKQLEEMVDFVSSRLGTSLDRSALKNAIEKTNRARALMVELYNLAKNKPSPVRSKDLKDFGILIALFLGTDAAIEIAQAYKDEFELRLRSGADENERIRLLWIQNRIQFKNSLVEMLEENYGTKIVVDEWNDINWEPIDPDDPYVGLAKRMLAIPLHGAMEYRVKHLQKLALEYKVDGAIHPCHWGCRQGTGARGLIQRGLKDIGVPVLNLEVDCVDERNFAEGQLKTRLEAFCEMILEKK